MSARIVLLAGDLVWHRALANRLAGAEGAEVVGVVAQTKARATTSPLARLRKNPKDFRRRVGMRLASGPLYRDIDAQATREFGRGGEVQPWPDAPVLDVDNVNTDAVGQFVRDLRPDVICVSGTAIVREPVISMEPPLGMLNLHTGISPYYKGGPNCTLWCLANGEPWAIGSTIHILDPGIDSGALVRTDRVDAQADDTAADLAIKAITLGHDLYVAAVEHVARHGRVAPVPQDAVDPGRTYYTREWTGARTWAARRFVSSGRFRRWAEAGQPVPPDFRLVDALVPPDEPS